jgi:hypothetical protein
MKSIAKRLGSCFCFVIGTVAVCALQAQTSSRAAERLTTECVRWLTATWFHDPADASDFCSESAKSVLGWTGNAGRCLHPEKRATEGTSAIVCQGAGSRTKDLSLAAGFEAASGDPADSDGCRQVMAIPG